VVAATPARADTAITDADRAALQGFTGMWQAPPRQQQQQGLRRNDSHTPPRRNETDDTSRLLHIEGLAAGDRRVYRQMTPEGKAAFESMDPRQAPTNNCMAAGVPTLALVPQTQEWSLTDDALTIHHESFDTVRAVHLDGRLASGLPTQLGHAVGAFANGELTIVTTHMKASLGALSRNAPGSEARTVTERYRLSPDQQSLNGTITVEDPRYLTQPLMLKVRLVRAPEGTEIVSFPCDVAASQRYLD